MSQKQNTDYIHCNSCDYEGVGATNSQNTFLIFFLLLCTSVFFLPLIIVALVYMGWFVAKPVQKHCPKCKSKDVIGINKIQKQKYDSLEDVAVTPDNSSK